MKKMITALILLFLIVAPIRAAHAQSTVEWTSPINLSRSGAASQPRIMAAADGNLQAFWWDRFDGLMSAVTTVDQGNPEPVWSAPFPAPISSKYLEETPFLTSDASGLVHAFWLETIQEAANTGAGAGPVSTKPTSLMHSQLRFGENAWTYPDILAESAIDFSVASPPNGEITVGYLRTEHTPDFPAGVYVKHNYGSEEGWGVSSVVYPSIYFRLLTPDQAQISLADNGDAPSEGKHTLYLSWFDPHQEDLEFSMSEDSGQTWSQILSLSGLAESRENPRLASNGKTFMIWQDTAQVGCALYQQILLDNSMPSATEGSSSVWSPAQRIFEGLSDCPTDDHFLPYGDDLLWLWNEGSTNLTLALWNQGANSWSEPLDLSFSYKDPDTLKVVSLNDLHATLSGENLAVVGTDDASGEVWFTQTLVRTLDPAIASPTPWSSLLRFSSEQQVAVIPALATDQDGGIHMVWSPATLSSSPGNSLYYALIDAGNPSRAAEILSATPGEIAHQPGLLYDPTTNMLQMVWSGGQDGSILYSRANVNEASGSAGWIAPQNLSGHGNASLPQIAQDAAGVLYVLYIIPLNEGRGVYLVHSDDNGDSWTTPRLVFDAAAANWPMVDKPALAVGPDGVVHIAWVQAAIPGMGTPMGIYYAKSTDHGETWTEPLALAGPGYSWPRLALSGEDIHLLYASSENGKGVLLHRRAGIDQQAENLASWSIPSFIPGWSMVALPFGLTKSGGVGETSQPSQTLLHLVGADPLSGALWYSFWDGAKWSARETLDKTGEINSGLGVSAITPAQGGSLGTAWLAVPVGVADQVPALYFTSRAIPSVELPGFVQPTPVTVATLAVTPTLTAEPSPVPSPTPNLNQIVTSSADIPIPPMALGGVVAAIIIVGIFGWRYLMYRIRLRAR